jgi:hypothetical protein
MRRTALIAVALAVLALASAANAQTSQSAKTQRKPGLATTAHAAHRPLHDVGRTAATPRKTYPNSQARLSSTRTKRTPEEAGREAGLAILRQRAGAQAPRRRVVKTVRRHSARRVRLERAAWRPEDSGARRIAESNEAAGDSAVPETGPTENDEAQGIESRRMSAAREAMPATSSDEENDSADAGKAAVERKTPNKAKAERTDDGAAHDGYETSAAALSQSSEEADSALARREGDEASLVIPRSGMPGPLRGSLASLERQNDRLEAEGLERIEDEADLAARIADKLLVPIPASNALTVNPDLEENHRYCRPWTAKFLADLARAHDAAFHRSIEVSSAVRTVEYQKRLMQTNGNAAPAEGDMVSPHLTGATVDIAKKGLSRAEMAWMRRRLMGLEASGKIDVEEEFKQACFHITVYKSYATAGKAEPATPAKPVADRPRRLKAEPVEAQGA